MHAFAAGTIVAKSYLSFARALERSFRAHHPDIPFFVLLADEVDGWFDPAAETFDVVRLADLQIPSLERFRFHYDQQPLSYACTPFFIRYLLDRGFSKVVFFKQETLVLGNVGSLVALLGQAPVVLTPHLVAPLARADRIARELKILQSGAYNVGVLGVSDTPVARRFLAWWEDRVWTHCRHAVGDGMHFEQRWLDLAPALFDGTRILRDPSYNVGHWNLDERAVEVRDGTVLVQGQPCRVFRFSGYTPDAPRVVTRYNDRLTWDALGAARLVFDRFQKALEAADVQRTWQWPFAFAQFDNGVPIPAIARRILADCADGAAAFGNPFRTEGPESYFKWLNGPCDGQRRGVTRLWCAVWDGRPDLQRAFPRVRNAATARDCRAFAQWVADSGRREHAVAPEFPALAS